MFRWKGIIGFGVLVAIVLIISLLFIDGWLASGIETAGETLVGAKVEVDGLNLSFSDMKIRWEKLQVTDPQDTWKNMIETAVCELDLEFLPLLSGKVIVENFQISGMRSGTKRETDGKLEVEREDGGGEPNFIARTAGHLKKEAEQTPELQLDTYTGKMNTDSLLAMLDLQTPKKIDSLQKDLSAKYETWQQNLSPEKYEGELAKVDQQIKAIDTKKIKNIKDAQKALSAVKSVRKSVDGLTKNVSGLKKQLQSDLKSARNSAGQVDDWISADYRKAYSMAKLPDVSAQNIGKMLFGKQLVDQVYEYLGYLSKAREYANKVSSDKPEKESPPRLKGQDIYFFSAHARPDWWIKKIELSGQTADGIQLTGLVTDIVSDQRQIGKSTQIDVHSAKGQRNLSLTGELNYLQDQPAEQFAFNFSGFSLVDMTLSQSELMPKRIAAGTGSVDAGLTIAGETIDGRVKFAGYKMNFDFEGKQAGGTGAEMIRSVLQDVDELNFIARISGEKDALKFSLQSNLDKLLVDRIKAKLSGEVDKAKQKIRQRVDDEVEKYRAKLNGLVAEKEQLLNGQLKKLEGLVGDKVKLADGKKTEIEKQKNKLGDKVKDALKGLF